MKDDNFDDYFDESDAPAAVSQPEPKSAAAPAADGSKHVDFTDDIADDEAKAKAASLGAEDAGVKKRKPRFLAYAIAVIVIGLGVTCYFRYFNPYVTEARVTGYVTQIERRGMIFKTFEGEMISESALTDTTRIYSRDFNFSVTDQAIVRELQAIQGSGRPVTLEYVRYYATVPWRGSQPIVVTGIVDK